MQETFPWVQAGEDHFACKMRPKILPCLQRLEAKESDFLLFLMQYLYCMCLYPMNNCARTRIVH